MNIFYDDDELTGVRMVQSVLDLFDNRPSLQRMTLGLLASMEQDVSDEDDYGADSLARGRSDFHLCSSLSDNSRDRGLNRAWSSSSVHKLTPHYYTVPRLASVNIQEEESDSERRASSLEEKRKVKKKAEKKRLKKQKQKERKRLEKLDKTKQSPVNNEVTEEKDDPQKSEPEVNKAVNGDSKNDNKLTFGIKLTAKKKDSTEDESSGDSEELDMTSSFVSKAALIAQRKLEQKAKPERKEKKNTSVHEETKSSPTKANEDPEVEKKDSAAATPTLVDNVKVSTEYAITGNRFASAGDFNMAVKYFTDAIKHNPTEFKLFGNRSFCFEKMQQYEKSLADAELSLSMCPGWVKGLFRRGRALAGLKRYEEAAQAFREVLKKDGSCAEAAQELMRVQITQIMEYGFTREQSSNALIIHGTVKKALEVLTNLNNQPGAAQATSHPAQIANFTGVSRVLSASATPATTPPPQSHDAPKPKNKPLGPVQNMSNVQSHPKPAAHPANVPPPQELFPVWVGNLVYPVTEFQLIKIFNKIGYVHSVKLLIARRCAFVNYSIREFCDEAIRRFNGFELNGNKIAVRYPDRFPPGLGISRSALKADDMQDENFRHVDFGDGRKAVGLQRPYRPHRDFPDCSGNHKY